jgi:hypothetical protein
MICLCVPVRDRFWGVSESGGERKLVDAAGIEPATSRLRVECSTS